jgi:chromosome partitioning protein
MGLAMKIIVFAGTKGGSGRSTLCWNVAIEAVRDGHTVYLADRDPQKTVEELWRKRSREPDLFRDDNPLLLENVDTISGARRRLLESGYEREFLFVDLPGSFMPIIREAVAAADCVVLPVQPSPKDLLAQDAMGQIIGELGKAAQTILVLNRIDARDNLVEQAARKLGPLAPNPLIRIKHRVAYKRADLEGKAATEIDREAAEEIAYLWKKVQRVVRRTDGQTARHEADGKVGARRAR